MLNPNPDMIPQETWDTQMKATFGEEAYMLQTYFYKEENYISEIKAGKEEGYMVYNPKDKLIYSWQKGSNEALASDSSVYPDEIIKVEHSEEKETVLDITCSILVITSKAGTIKLWYNKKHLKMDPSFFIGHKFGHWDTILKEINCLPLKVEQKGFMTHLIQTALSFEEQKIEDSKFKLPTFSKVNGK